MALSWFELQILKMHQMSDGILSSNINHQPQWFKVRGEDAIKIWTYLNNKM